MNIKKFNIEIHQLLFGLLISSGVPALINNSILFASFDLNLKFILYIIFLAIREFFIFILGFKIIIILFKKLNLGRIRYRTLIAFLPLIPILLLLIYDFKPILFFSGLRLYILFSLPLLILEENSNLNFKRNIIINDLIFYFYFILNILSFTIGYGDFSPIPGSAQIGETLLGKRYIFNTPNPIIAAQQFGIFLLYTNFRITIEKNNFEKIKFLIISMILLFFTLFTGGRAGLVVAFIAMISSLMIYFFPKIKFIFLTQKSIKNKFFTVGILFLFSIFLFLFSSNSLLSGRVQTEGQLRDRGIITGVYGNRLKILNTYFKKTNILEILAGKPGMGTNTACNKVTSKVTSDECRTTDSLFTTSLVSFGLIGILFFIVTLKVVINSSYSPLMAIAFLVYSLSQIFPEIVLAWSQFVLIIFHSIQKEKINNLRIIKDE